MRRYRWSSYVPILVLGVFLAFFFGASADALQQSRVSQVDEERAAIGMTLFSDFQSAHPLSARPTSEPFFALREGSTSIDRGFEPALWLRARLLLPVRIVDPFVEAATGVFSLEDYLGDEVTTTGIGALDRADRARSTATLLGVPTDEAVLYNKLGGFEVREKQLDAAQTLVGRDEAAGPLDPMLHALGYSIKKRFARLAGAELREIEGRISRYRADGVPPARSIDLVKEESTAGKDNADAAKFLDYFGKNKYRPDGARVEAIVEFLIRAGRI